MMLLLGQVPSTHTCPKLTLCSVSVHIINPVKGFIFFSTLVYHLNRQLTDMENGLHLMTFLPHEMWCDCPIIHTCCLVAVGEYFSVMFESGNIFRSSRLRW